MGHIPLSEYPPEILAYLRKYEQQATKGHRELKIADEIFIQHLERHIGRLSIHLNFPIFTKYHREELINDIKAERTELSKLYENVGSHRKDITLIQNALHLIHQQGASPGVALEMDDEYTANKLKVMIGEVIDFITAMISILDRAIEIIQERPKDEYTDNSILQPIIQDLNLVLKRARELKDELGDLSAQEVLFQRVVNAFVKKLYAS
ncbi:hypothetical protein HYV86_01355 [Candidatus Woesearchaeota archaeon]|nr:hypothetical protein [Candidatus Woesearchaeota archaeon]